VKNHHIKRSGGAKKLVRKKRGTGRGAFKRALPGRSFSKALDALNAKNERRENSGTRGALILVFSTGVGVGVK